MVEKRQFKRSLTAKDAVSILEKDGVKVTEKEAEDILNLMYFLAKIIVKQNFIEKK